MPESGAYKHAQLGLRDEANATVSERGPALELVKEPLHIMVVILERREAGRSVGKGGLGVPPCGPVIDFLHTEVGRDLGVEAVQRCEPCARRPVRRIIPGGMATNMPLETLAMNPLVLKTST